MAEADVNCSRDKESVFGVFVRVAAANSEPVNHKGRYRSSQRKAFYNIARAQVFLSHHEQHFFLR